MKSWFSIRAQTATAPAEVSIYGDIGAWGVSAASFIDQVKAVQGPIRVRVDSKGGDVFEGLALYNYLASRGNVETVIDGVAASAASLPFLAGTKRTIPKAAYLMIHNPWSGAIGNASEMRKVADTLDRIGAGLVHIYSRVTGMAVEAVQALMDAETWMAGDAALAGGWATDVVDFGPVKASIRPGRYANAPAVIVGASWTAPEAARNAFRKGIQQSEDGLAGDGLEAATVKEARALASGERPTENKVRKANAWWGRNERFLDAEANTPADVAANLWGGAAGRDWFRSLFSELESEAKAAAPNELATGDYVTLTYGDGETKGEVVEVITSGTAAGADGSVEATPEDPAALVDVLREVDGTGQFQETDVQVARLFSALTKTDAPAIVEIESPDAKALDNQTKTMSKTAKLLALLGVQPAAEDSFLASAIADLGVTPEAVTEARKTGTTDFLATHIADRIAAADGVAKAATDRTSAILAKLGIDTKEADPAAKVADVIEAKASAKAAELLARHGIPASKLAAAAGKPSDDPTDKAEIVAKFNAMKPGAERSDFFARHRNIIAP